MMNPLYADHLHQRKERNFVYISSSSKFIFSFSVTIETFCSGKIIHRQQFNLLLNFIDGSIISSCNVLTGVCLQEHWLPRFYDMYTVTPVFPGLPFLAM
uniref:Uncharacterized protein n=1 Tax=Lactuca sativa TaxID=4236 RepID=A0A9R1X1K6_LACSA|nr:hypothetical protein LSAT_V11C700343260 [Lactuca sativa]